jgi:hypothetical protein
MAFIKGIAAGAAGAAAYNLYHEVDISPGKDIASGLFEAFQRKGAAQVAEVGGAAAASCPRHGCVGVSTGICEEAPVKRGRLSTSNKQLVGFAGPRRTSQSVPRPTAKSAAQMSRMHRQVDDLQSALLKALHDKTQPTVIVQGSGRPSGCVDARVPAGRGCWRPRRRLQHPQGACRGQMPSLLLHLQHAAGLVGSHCKGQLLQVQGANIFVLALTCGPSPPLRRSTVTGAIVVVGGVVLYLRFVRGWRFSDMMYVTKGALTAMQETVTASERAGRAGVGESDLLGQLPRLGPAPSVSGKPEALLATVLLVPYPCLPIPASSPHRTSPGLTNMKVQVEAATAELVARMSTVADKQDDMLQRQEDMDGQLQDVGERVEHVQGGIAVLQHQAAYTNHAITMLCGALSEVAKRVGLGNGRYVRALDNIVHGAPQPAQQRIEGSSGGAMAALPVRVVVGGSSSGQDGAAGCCPWGAGDGVLVGGRQPGQKPQGMLQAPSSPASP